ncbi:uncharacterized protein LOC106673736 [Cimex lectularius]|uniref:Uncharacterized protein n=1 Tax=Cimex lectularius TaxID=79782 RepID=A0A8I6SC08_CIMLE|nr:uncharacterized protein LOC106673736 [Cimex lectularius]
MLNHANISLLNKMIYNYRKQENHVKEMLQENIQWQNRFQDRLRKEELSSKQKVEIHDTLFNLQKLYKLLQQEQEIFYRQSMECSFQSYEKNISYDSLEKQQHYNKQVQNVIQQQLHILSELLSATFSPSKRRKSASCVTSEVDISLEILNDSVLRNIEQQQQQMLLLEENQPDTKEWKMAEANLKKLKTQQKIHVHLEQNLQRQQFIKRRLRDQVLSQEEYQKYANDMHTLRTQRQQLFQFHESLQDEFNQFKTGSYIKTKNMASDLVCTLALQQTQNLFNYISQQQNVNNVLEQKQTL